MGKWLEGFKTWPGEKPWSISNQLLCENRDVETISFAAQTMRFRVLEMFDELPSPEAAEELRTSLIQHINRQENLVTLTQLCLALADLCLQMPQNTE